MSDPDAVGAVLDERPDLEGPLEAILAVDDEEQTWTFEDVPVDSGPFGELVGRGVVESAGEQYRLAEPAAVRTALAGEGGAVESDASAVVPSPSTAFTPGIDRRTAAFVAAAVAFVGLVRVHPVASIYRDGDVVLSGNDPYAYRYWIERVVEGASGGGLPGNVLNGEPLYVVSMGVVSDLLGGVVAVDHVLAWYPVVAAVLGGVVVYLLAVRVTGDRRVGVAAVVFLALIPGHALRTSIGYADHHAFDYLWMGATALAVTWLADVDRAALRAPRTWGLIVGLGVAIAGQVLAWDAGPLLVVPLGTIVAGRAAVDVRRGESPLPAGVPVVAGLALGSATAFAVHGLADFQTTVVVLSPAVAAGGSAIVVASALAVHRLGWGVHRLLVGYAVGAVVGLALLVVVLTPVWEPFAARLDQLFRGGAIAETQSLFSGQTFGFLFLFGLALLLALPAMAVGLRRSIDDGRWLVVTAYAWYFFLLATLQVRFVGELATFTALFAGYAFVQVAAWIDAVPRVARSPEGPAPLRMPSRRVLATVLALLVLFGGFGALQVGVKTSQVVIDDDVYESATFVEEAATERGLEYPRNYVLSNWGRNRVYNYFVNGESSGYGYAFRNYREFALGTDADDWYDQFEGRVGYVVLETAPDGFDPRSTGWRLTRNYGSADDGVPGVGHYRVLFVPEGRSRTVASVVPGANLTGTGDPGTDVTVATAVDAEGVEFTYERRTRVADDGDWSLRVAQPGTYEVSAGNETTEVGVTEAAVRRGGRVDGG